MKERKGHISLDPSSPLASSLAPFVLTSPQQPPHPPPPAPTPNLHASASFPSPSPLFMKVNLWVYQELLAGGGLRRSNHNKASPSAWNRNGAEGKAAPLPPARIYARCCTHTSHYLLTSVPVVFLLYPFDSRHTPLAPWITRWVVFLLLLLLFLFLPPPLTLYCSI